MSLHGDVAHRLAGREVEWRSDEFGSGGAVALIEIAGALGEQEVAAGIDAVEGEAALGVGDGSGEGDSGRAVHAARGRERFQPDGCFLQGSAGGRADHAAGDGGFLVGVAPGTRRLAV